jgi:hypothetical protein
MPSLRLTTESVRSWDEWIRRYPDEFHGSAEWKKQTIEGEQWYPPLLPRPLELNLRISRRQSSPPRPRAFVSHRQGDEKAAERIASLADKHGFEFWIDTINLPPPSVVASMLGLSIALRIEMALLNCSHIVAVYTDKTSESTWVPYEYGRVKEPVLQTARCCTWLHTIKRYPEWVELNSKQTRETDLDRWLADEFIEWCDDHPGCPTRKPVGAWKWRTVPLP